jgi:hypothetical protein
MCIITLGRQFGSGGHELGRRLATALNIDFYDNELITLAAKEAGLAPEFFAQSDEKIAGARFSAGGMGGFPLGAPLFGYLPLLPNDTLFQIQAGLVRDLAQKGSGLFVGRCADYILREHPKRISLFVHAPLEARIQRVRQRLQEEQPTQSWDDKALGDLILKKDKARAAYYHHYTGKTWGAAASYDLCFNSELDFEDNLIAFLKNL